MYIFIICVRLRSFEPHLNHTRAQFWRFLVVLAGRNRGENAFVDDFCKRNLHLRLLEKLETIVHRCCFRFLFCLFSPSKFQSHANRLCLGITFATDCCFKSLRCVAMWLRHCVMPAHCSRSANALQTFSTQSTTTIDQSPCDSTRSMWPHCSVSSTYFDAIGA